jgi:hypothetical protein
MILLISAFQVARIIGVSHWCPAESFSFKKGKWERLVVFMKFLE